MTLYTDHPILSIPTMPGRYRAKTGFVYAIFCTRKLIKIGSSTNPKVRIGEQCGGGSLFIWIGERVTRSKFDVRKILLSEERADFRIIERNIHRLLSPFRIRPTKEHYELNADLAVAIEAVFGGDFSDPAQSAMADVVRAEINSWRPSEEAA